MPQSKTPLRLSAGDERAYTALAADRSTTAADLKAFASQRGFTVTDEAASSFIAARARKGTTVGQTVVYRIDLPDGSAYDVEAPEGASEDDIAQQVLSQIASLPAPANDFRQDLGAIAGNLADGLIPGSAAAIRGAMRGVVGNALGAAFGDATFDPGKAYQDAAAEQEQVQSRFNANHPDWATALNVGGMALGAVALPQARLLKGAGLARGALNSAATGAGYGALSGALNDTGGGRLENAGLGALAGGAIGAAAPVALNRVASGAATARRNVPGLNGILTAGENLGRRVIGREALPASTAAHAQAERLLGQSLDDVTIDAGMGTGAVPATPSTIADEVIRRQELGIPAMPGDVAEPLRRATARAVRGEGRMATRARGAVATRQAQQGARLRTALSAELGEAVDPIAAAAAITSRAKVAAGPAYQAAYAAGSPMVVTEELEGIMRRPAFQESLRTAYGNIQNRGGDPEALGFRWDRNTGEVALSEGPTFEAFDQVVRTLNAGIKRSDLTGRPLLDNQSAAFATVATDLDNYLKRSNGSYAAAKRDYADDMAIRDALERGGKVSALTGPEIADQLRSMPEHSREAWTVGARTALADQATATGLRPEVDGSQALRTALGLSGAGLNVSAGDVAKREALETMTGRPGVFQRLDDRLEAEHQAYGTFAETAASGRRPGAGEGNGALQAASQAYGVARKAAQGRVIGALSDVVLRANPRGTAAFRREVDDRTAELLTAGDPQAVRSAMSAVERRKVSDVARQGALYSKASNMGRLGALSAAAQSTDPVDEPGPWDPWAPED